MKALFKGIAASAVALLATPVVALAMGGMAMDEASIETAINVGYWLSLIGFVIATVVTFVAIRKFGASTLGAIFTYLLIGTTTFFVITVFQSLGGEFFGIGDEAMDVWWHIMFYLAFAYYFWGLKLLIGLGSADQSPNQGVRVGVEKFWALIAVAVLAVIFVIPSWVTPYVDSYTGSILYSMGLHHFIAFALAGVVGYYLMSAKKRIGQIGHAIANPMVIAVWALSLQHFWELLSESWKVVAVESAVIEGVEKIFLVTAAVGITYAAWRLTTFARG